MTDTLLLPLDFPADTPSDRQGCRRVRRRNSKRPDLCGKIITGATLLRLALGVRHEDGTWSSPPNAEVAATLLTWLEHNLGRAHTKAQMAELLVELRRAATRTARHTS